MEWMVLPLKRYFDFGGRSRRREYWMFFLFTIMLSIVAGIIDNMLGYGSSYRTVTDTSVSAGATSNGPVAALVSLGLLIPSLSVGFRRLHDTDRSAWWLLLILLPLLGWIALLVSIARRGHAAPTGSVPIPRARTWSRYSAKPASAALAGKGGVGYRPRRRGAPVAKLVDAFDSKSNAARHAGSSPARGTKRFRRISCRASGGAALPPATANLRKQHGRLAGRYQPGPEIEPDRDSQPETGWGGPASQDSTGQLGFSHRRVRAAALLQ